MSDRLRELAERQFWLRERCDAQRAAVAAEVARMEARVARVDRMAGLARGALLHPLVLVGGAVALLTIGRLGGLRLIGRLFALSTTARRLFRLIRSF